MTSAELFDSTVWLDYLIKGNFKEKIEREEVFALSSFSLFEIRRKLLRNKTLKKQEIEEKMDFIKRKSIIIPIDESIAEKAAEIAEKNNLGAADAIIYTTARINNAILFTLDNDFRGLDNVQLLLPSS